MAPSKSTAPVWPDDYDAETVAMSGGTGRAAAEYMRRTREPTAEAWEWVDVSKTLPACIHTVLVWVVGGPRHYGEDYIDVGVWNAHRGRWQTSVGSGDIDVEVSHWAHVPPPPGKVRQ